MRVRLDGDRALSYEPFVTGFLIHAKDEVWGRPVDVAVLDDGSLRLSADHAGASIGSSAVADWAGAPYGPFRKPISS